jgi:hypothetical protein
VREREAGAPIVGRKNHVRESLSEVFHIGGGPDAPPALKAIDIGMRATLGGNRYRAADSRFRR